MYNEKEIKTIVDSVIEQVKKQYPPNNRVTKPETPEYYTGYKESISYMERVKNHAEIGIFPEKLFLNKAPNITPVEYDYLKGNFKQTTLPVWVDFISTISLPFQDGNWSVVYSEDDSVYETSKETLQQYCESGIKKYGSLENFMKFSVPHLKSVDANGVVAIKPYEVHKLEDGKSDTSKLLEPQPYYYRCDQIVSKLEERYYLILLDERSEVKYSNAVKKVGFVFEFYDENVIWRISQTGEYVDFKFEYEIYFEHNEGVIPVNVFKGIPKVISNEVIWMPAFIYGCDNLDLALMNKNYLQVSISFACFPYLVMVGDDCDYEYHDTESGQLIRCNEGWLELPNQTRRKCTSCYGSGMKDRVSPMGKLLLKKGESWKGEGDKSFAGKAMEYVSPDTTALEFVEKTVDKDTEAARGILHLQRSNSKVQGSENPDTATGQSLDQKAKFAFVKPQSDQIFDMYYFCYNRIGWQRYGNKYKAPVLTYPNTFDYNTEEDYMYRIVEAQKAGWPPYMIQTIFYRYLHTLYFNEKKTMDVFSLITQSDRLLVISQDEINIKLTRGLVEKWESILHDSALQFVESLVSENKGFFGLDFTEQKKQLIQKAKDKANDIAKAATPEQSAVDDILNDNGGGAIVADNLGKLPLALQQLALASTRAKESGNNKLSAMIDSKMKELVKSLDVESA